MRSRRLLKLRHLAEYFVFRSFVCVLAIMSPRRSRRFAEGTAKFFFRVLPRKLTRYRVARENLEIAFGDKITDERADEIIFGMWVHLFRMVAEITVMHRKIARANVMDVIRFRNPDQVVKALASDRPVILLSGHYGNWEMSISVFGHFGFPMSVVARPLDNPYLDGWFEQFRQSTGHSMIAKKGAFNRMAAVLERGGSIALLGDQDAGARGTFGGFFGRKASTFPTIARLAIEYDAYVALGYSCRLSDDFEGSRWMKYELGSEEVIDPRDFEGDDQIERITQAFTDALERAIHIAPEQYFWVHRRWKTRPKNESRSEPAGLNVVRAA